MSDPFDFDAPADQYAVMGNPIGHSKSPLIHRTFARQTGQHMEYCAIQVDDGGFEQAVGNFQANGGKGLNVTVPFKQDAWRLVDERSDHAERAGAVNTIVFREDGCRYGDNSDGIGLIRDIRNNHGGEIQQRRILLMGAGGAVRGVLTPLLDQNPADIVIVNRTIAKAQALALEFGRGPSGNALPLSACGYDMLAGRQFDLIINATSASLHGELPPLPDDILANGGWCYDMMYGADPTVFLRWAETVGAGQTLDGLGMLVEQAAAAFELWRGVRPDTAPVIDMLRRNTA